MLEAFSVSAYQVFHFEVCKVEDPVIKRLTLLLYKPVNAAIVIRSWGFPVVWL